MLVVRVVPEEVVGEPLSCSPVLLKNFVWVFV